MPSHKTTVNVLILVFACMLLFLPGSWKRGLWSPDETRYVTVSKEMVDSGDWITLRRNGEIYTQKPPVFFWTVSLFGLLFGGFSELSARMPSALSGTGTVLLAYLLARKLFDERTALTSGLILCTSLAYFVSSQMVMLDQLFTFLVVLSLFLLYSGLSREKGRGIFYFSAMIPAALATLTKGPIGFIIPLLAVTAYALSAKKARLLLSPGMFAGVAALMAMAAAWLIPACIKGGEAYTNELLIKQIFGRYLSAFDHKEPFFYYFYAFPAGFFPWIIIFPSAFYLLVKERRDTRSKFLIAWLLAVFVFFTTSKSKNILYILPMYPAAAIAAAHYWNSRKRPMAAVAACTAAVIALNASISFFVMPYIDLLKSPKHFSSQILGYVGPDDGLSTFRINPAYWSFYCRRGHINELDDNVKLDEYLGSGKRVFCIIDLASYREYMTSCRNRGHLLAYMPYGSRKSLGLISNRIR